MTIKKKDPREGKIEIDIDGPDGNAFALMGHARRFGKQLNLDVDTIIGEMMELDYENLLEVFDSYFGEYVDLVRT